MKNDRVITFIHYGSKSFDVNMFNPVSNGFKPQGGLWACPYLETKDMSEWVEWCKSSDFLLDKYTKDNYFKFTLSADTNLLVVNQSNYKTLPYKEAEGLGYIQYLDVEKLSTEYDAVYVDLWSIQNNWIIFPMWDVPSLLVFNPDVVKEVD